MKFGVSKRSRRRRRARQSRLGAVELKELTQTSGEWLRGNGPEADIVISSRVRLARNLAEFPFISRATPQDRVQIERILRDSHHHFPGLGRSALYRRR